ncbi:hypothetical protein N9O61_06755 [Octadecabacter sp.]|nr:hypothetical protein [Octadecabacter sp.]
MGRRDLDDLRSSRSEQRWTHRIRDYAPYIFIVCVGVGWLLLIFASPNI